MYGILIICDDDDSNGYDDMMIVYVKKQYAGLYDVMVLFMFESFVLYIQIIIISCSIAKNDIYRIHLYTIEFTQCSYGLFYTYAL